MNSPCRWFANRFAPGFQNPTDVEARSRLGMLEGWVSLVSNLGLALGKGALALLTGSLSLMADAIHTASDSVSSVIVILGFRLARKPADAQHPYGHGRAEPIAGVILAVLMAVVAFELGREGVERLFAPQAIEVPWWVVVVVGATVPVKELLARFSLGLGRLIDSSALEADAWHHRSDALSTGLVVAAFLGARLGAPWLDGAATVAVALLVAVAAFHTLRRVSNPLLGEAAPDQVVAEVARLARSVEGVRSAHDILVQRYGPTHIVSLHIEVPHDLTAVEVHGLSETVEERVLERFPGHASVHADPVNRDHPHYEDVQSIVRRVTETLDNCMSFHELRIVGSDDRFRVLFDVTTGREEPRASLESCRRTFEASIRERFPLADVRVSFDPPFLKDAPED